MRERRPRPPLRPRHGARPPFHPACESLSSRRRARRRVESHGARGRPSRAGRGSGAGSGFQGFGAAIGASGARSIKTEISSAPAMPSIMQWCVLEISAKRSASSPSTNHISHSGFPRSSCCDMMRPTSRLSASSSPGRGSRGVANVVGDIEVIVVDPDRMSFARHPRNPLAEARHAVEACFDRRTHAIDVEAALVACEGDRARR